MQPSVFLFYCVHVSVEVVQILVFEQLVIDQIKLTSCIVIALVVTNAREIQPLRMTKFIS